MGQDDKNKKPSKYDWLLDMKESDLRDALRLHEKDALLIYDRCGLDVLTSLWENLHGIPVYPSKKALYAMAAKYVRKNYDPADSANSKKQMAATIGVSLRFVEMALDTTAKDDPRQMDAFARTELP